jgi:hypothetical protein
MSTERTERPEQNDLASAPPIEPVYPGAGDDAAGDEQLRFDLSAVQSIEPVHRGADDAIGDEQDRVDLSAVQSIEPVHRGAEDTPSAAAPTLEQLNERLDTVRAPGPPDSMPPPLRETAEPSDGAPATEAPAVTEAPAPADAAQPADAPPSTDPVIAEAHAGWKETVGNIYGEVRPYVDTAKTALEAAGVAEKVKDFVVSHAADFQAVGEKFLHVFK